MEDYGRRTQDILVLSHCGFAENFDDLHGSPDSDINGKSQEKLRSNLRSEIGIFRFQQAESSPQRSPEHLDNGKCVESEYQSQSSRTTMKGDGWQKRSLVNYPSPAEQDQARKMARGRSDKSQIRLDHDAVASD